MRLSEELTAEASIKSLLYTIQKTLSNVEKKIDNLERRVDKQTNAIKLLEQKFETSQPRQGVYMNQNISKPTTSQKRSYGSLPSSPTSPSPEVTNPADANVSQNVTLITLNNESDYPNGSWLGDENNPNLRVRTPVTPANLLHVNTNCRSAEKMALTLLDYLFDRETQAVSNLSGMGKHGKKQLDPLMIFGIRCHLIHKFSISEGDWHRIKQNIDSKCRTAFRRRSKGMPLTVKAFKNRPNTNSSSSGNNTTYVTNESSDLNLGIEGVDMVSSPNSEIQVFHATPEQLEALRTGQIQVVQQTVANNDDVQISAVPLTPDTFRIVHAEASDGVSASE
ncbi:unnamed protein product [Dimorphilus gyrociliatus]|nr:unnamed protein product [Dimorphilus gyrociliatus]